MDKYLMNLHRFTLGFLLLAAIVVTACKKSSPTASAAADTLSAAGGDAQQGIVAQQLQSPLIVQVNDASGNAVAGVAVTWAITAGGGSLSSATTTSDANGRAEVLWTAGTAAGSASATASIDGGATVTFHATLVADLPASLMKVSGDNQIGPDGAALSPFVVEAVDQYWEPRGRGADHVDGQRRRCTQRHGDDDGRQRDGPGCPDDRPGAGGIQRLERAPTGSRRSSFSPQVSSRGMRGNADGPAAESAAGPSGYRYLASYGRGCLLRIISDLRV